MSAVTTHELELAFQSDFGDFHQPESHRPPRRRKVGISIEAEIPITNTDTPPRTFPKTLHTNPATRKEHKNPAKTNCKLNLFRIKATIYKKTVLL
jgi:hypothetical protein